MGDVTPTQTRDQACMLPTQLFDGMLRLQRTPHGSVSVPRTSLKVCASRHNATVHSPGCHRVSGGGQQLTHAVAFNVGSAYMPDMHTKSPPSGLQISDKL
jgi:hypothetical protein